MPTILQEKLADEIVKNVKLKKPKNKKELLVSVGYAELTATQNASAVLEQKGVQEALEERGFTEDNAKRVVEKILNSDKTEPNARLKAADMVFKVHGSYAPDKHLNINLGQKYDPKDKAIVELRNKYEEELRTKLQDE